MERSLDAAHPVHPDAKTHLGMTMTMGNGDVVSILLKETVKWISPAVEQVKNGALIAGKGLLTAQK